MGLSEQLLITGALLVAAGVACVLFSFAGRFVRSPQPVVPAIPEVKPPVPVFELPPVYVPSAPVPAPVYATSVREAPGFGVLVFGIVLLVVTGVLGYSVETRKTRRHTA